MALDTTHENGTTKNCDRISSTERSVQKYLTSFLLEEQPHHPLPADNGRGMRESFDREFCCGTSQSLYCKECCRLLVPTHSLPVPVSRRKKSISEGLNLPFNLHIILDDRRGSATGLHAVALLDEDECIETDVTDDNPANHMNEVKLIDLARGDEMPKYQHMDEATTTFFLFPSPGESIPLESVASKVETLIVLDCKWTKRGMIRKSEDLSSLQKVHISSPPQESYYWRWHNAGKGMLSTIEAIFYAAFEVSQQKLLESNPTLEMNSNDNELTQDRNNLIHLLWLFGHQRAATFNAAHNEGVPAPCSDEGKAMQRALRKQKGTWRQLRHKEDEIRLREKNGLKETKDG